MNLTRRHCLLASAGILLPLNLFASTLPKFRTLIVIELQGGNDGLNTVVPITDERYRQLRPTLAIKKDRTLELSNTTFLNDALSDLMPAWEAGEVAIVQGLGYKNPNRSHFRSTDIWASASDAAVVKRSGWLHDALADYVDESELAALMFAGRDQSVRGGKVNVIGTNSLNELKEASPAHYLGQTGDGGAWIKRVSEITRRFQRQLIDLEAGKANYPSGVLAQQASEAARLIQASVAPPVIGLHLGGFDTHADQLGRHHELLSQLGSTVAALRSDLIESGHWRSTLVMTVSEFGRRAAENGSGGTDHGTAAPQFLIGGRVNGGFHGVAVDLSRLQEGDVRHTLDFRVMYASVLEGWLKIDSSHLVPNAHRLLPVIKT